MSRNGVRQAQMVSLPDAPSALTLSGVEGRPRLLDLDEPNGLTVGDPSVLGMKTVLALVHGRGLRVTNTLSPMSSCQWTATCGECGLRPRVEVTLHLHATTTIPTIAAGALLAYGDLVDVRCWPQFRQSASGARAVPF
jgi:hypothetical protein